MRVLTITLAQNESRLIRHFIRHYRRLGGVRVYDDHSTDDTASAATTEGARVIPIADNGHHEHKQMWVKNHSWKPVRNQYDWIIVVDVDEFLYHDNLIEVLRHSQELSVTVLLPCGYEMSSFEPPRDDIPITAQIRSGAFNPSYSKPCCFDPGRVDEINIWGGSHHATPSCPGGWHFFFPYPGLKLLHYKHLGVAWAAARISNRQRGLCVDAEQMTRNLHEIAARATEVIPEGPFQWFEHTPIESSPFFALGHVQPPRTTRPIPEPPVSRRPLGRWFS